ncbi:MAG: TlpA family protein disulfide reductase [Planctomycetes bacterium]|nr:TlpA family protein disulfide reductase [Planctomycetota bacterium]
MRDKINVRSMTAVAGLLLEAWALYVVGASPRRWRPALIVKDETAAHILYDAMIRAMGDARSLSYTSVCSNPDDRISTYRIWLQKPGSFHVEQTNDASTKSTTILDDGNCFWVHWTGDRPTLLLDTDKSRADARSDVYVKKASLAGGGSIQSEVALLGTALVGLIFDPSAFYGTGSPLAPYIDGIRGRGTNPVRGEVCDVIEVSFMRARRTWYIWLSRQDHLPRKFKEVDRGADTRVIVEEWSNVMANGAIPPKVLTWSPPQGYQQWNPPRLEDSLLPSGQEVPDFQLRSARRGKIRLSDYRGRVIWLYVWDTGAPQCREEMPGFQQLYREYRDKGPVFLGFNCSDDRRLARAFLRENHVTFPSVLDASEAATRLIRLDYGNKAGVLPLNYIIDPQGRVVDGWFGQEQDADRVLAALQKAGLELAQ